VDGRLGIVMLSGAGMAYAQASDYARGIAVYPDILYGSFCGEKRQFKAGEEVARRKIVLYLEASPKETARRGLKDRQAPAN
jgi:hypothetical protein